MSIAETSLTSLAGAVGRGLQMFAKRNDRAEPLDPYEPAPLSREDMAAMFDMDEAEPVWVAEKLRASEKHERETMSMIRSALYPSDGPRADANT